MARCMVDKKLSQQLLVQPMSHVSQLIWKAKCSEIPEASVSSEGSRIELPRMRQHPLGSCAAGTTGKKDKDESKHQTTLHPHPHPHPLVRGGRVVERKTPQSLTMTGADDTRMVQPL